MSLSAEEQREHGRKLRNRQLSGETLSAKEQAELAAFLHQIEQEESERLRAGAERSEARIAALQTARDSLQALIVREEALVERLRQAVVDAEQEQRSIQSEYKSLTQKTLSAL